jgi:hypothetical protein
MGSKRRLARSTKTPIRRAARGQTVQYHDDGYDANDIRYIATHEAGHAVAAVVLGSRLKSIDLKQRRLPDGRISVGFTDSQVDAADVAGKGEAAAMPYLIQTFAGPFAERTINHQLDASCESGGGDKEVARRIAAVAVCEAVYNDNQMVIPTEEQERNRDRIGKLIEDACEAAMHFVNEHVGTIIEVAEALIEKRELTGDEVAAIVNARRVDPA